MLLSVCWQTLGGRCWGSLSAPTTGTELSPPGSWSCALPSRCWRMGRVSSIPAPSRADLETWRHSVLIQRVQGRQGGTPETLLGSLSLTELSWDVRPRSWAGDGVHQPVCGEGAASCHGVGRRLQEASSRCPPSPWVGETRPDACLFSVMGFLHFQMIFTALRSANMSHPWGG